MADCDRFLPELLHKYHNFQSLFTQYIGVLYFDSRSAQIIAHSLVGASNPKGDDQVTLMMDTHPDYCTGPVFAINYTSVRFDAFQYTLEREPDENWHGVGDVRRKIPSKDWQAGIFIPFKTLCFHNDKGQLWGISFQCIFQRKNEEDLGSGYRDNGGVINLPVAGEIYEFVDLKWEPRFVLFSYSKFWIQRQDPVHPSQANLYKTGLNFEYVVTLTSSSYFPVNTAFPRREAGWAVINLFCFRLSPPERCVFFLEGTNRFCFSFFSFGRVFSSRRIGLFENGKEIPGPGDACLSVRAGKSSIEIPDVQTDRKGKSPGANFLLPLFQKDFLHPSKFRTIPPQVIVSGSGYMTQAVRPNLNLYGIHFLDIKNLVGDGYLTGIQTPDLKGDKINRRIPVGSSNDLFDCYFYLFEVEDNFNLEVSFVPRKNIHWSEVPFRYVPRPGIPDICKLAFKPKDLSYGTPISACVESNDTELRPPGFMRQSKTSFCFNLPQPLERLNEDFNICDGYRLPSCDCWFNCNEIQFEMNQRRMISSGIFVNRDNFSDGRRNVFIWLNLTKFSSHRFVRLGFRQDDIRFHEGSFPKQEWGSRIGYPFSIRLGTRTDIRGVMGIRTEFEPSPVLDSCSRQWFLSCSQSSGGE